MKTLKSKARIAGLWYLIMGITGMLGLLYVPSQIIVPDDSYQTFNNIIENQSLFRFGILANLVCQTSFLFTALAFEDLFKEVSVYWTRLLKTLVIAGVPIAFLNALLPIASLIISTEPAVYEGLTSEAAQSMSMLFLKVNSIGTMAVEIFWGLWLLPLGILFIKAVFMPSVIGYLLILGCLSYLIESFTGVMGFELSEDLSSALMIPLSLGEMSTILWLLIKGTKKL
ncbi:DUF4386 domain-containing protein [Jiulongibacter sp. NS-SX5]|uniref:DUF4386 domain-containing protein n=1 Tax=Jiulongibacter sp. NS-SX5 TaxID=3463854 RepID=UPI00405973D7